MRHASKPNSKSFWDKRVKAYLDHIGIAVTDHSPLAKVLAVLGLAITHHEHVTREHVLTEWVPLPVRQGNIELLHSTSPDATIGKFLQKTGRDAVHHLSFRVENIEEASNLLRAAGFKLIYDAAKPGAHNCLVNFIHPQTTGGVLIEISEGLEN
jgi:methylmalonyl-CoA/ethylmalonyl-CoA epimerase